VTLLLALSANPESAPVLLTDAALKTAASARLAGIQRCYIKEEDLESVDTHLDELRALERFWGAESTYHSRTASHSTETASHSTRTASHSTVTASHWIMLL
jgi:hypothetical protein